MARVRIEEQDGIASLILDRDIINALDPELVGELTSAIGDVARDRSVHGLVLTSANEKFFCIGFDLPSLLPLAPEEFRAFYRSFNQLCLMLYTLPKPTAVALTGHATGGGCIVALCCDYRFIAKGRCLMGLPEIKLGVPVPYVGDCMLRDLVGSRIAREMMDDGGFYEPDRLLAWGVVDRVLPPDRVREEAAARVTELGRAPAVCFARIKRNRTERVAAEIAARLAEREQWFLDCWFSPEARPKLAEARQRFVRDS